MPSGITDYGSSAWLSTLFNVSSAITTYYVALCTDEPGVATDGDILASIEPVDTAYARQPIAADSAHWGVADNSIANTVLVDFGIPTSDWGRITHYALCTNATSGDVYAWGEFLTPEYITASHLVQIPVGGIVLTLTALANPITL